MTRALGLRLFTALVVSGLSGFAVWQGGHIAAFTLAPRSAQGSHGAMTGLVTRVLEGNLAPASDPTNAPALARREDTLTALVAARPLSSKDWLLLAGTRAVAGLPLEGVLRAWRLSGITGPNEGAVMLQRGIFGLLEWPSAPSDLREQTIRDLATSLNETPVQDTQIAPARLILATEPKGTRDDVAGFLRAAGVSAADMGRMGL